MPHPENVELGGREGVFHVMVTVWRGAVIGQLVRWVWDDGEVGYEARFDGLDASGGLSNAAAATIGSCAALAYVAHEIRYEWEIIAGVYPAQGTLWPAPTIVRRAADDAVQ